MRKSYKEQSTFLSMGDRGQIALFVIIAIVIVGFFAVLFLYPRLSSTSNVESDPIGFMQQCIEPDLQKSLATIMHQGGSYQPTHSLKYNNTDVQYLCFTNQNYKPCVVEQPLIIRHVTQELQQRIQPVARQCFDSLKTAYESKGYTVSGNSGAINVSIVPGSIRLEFVAPLSVTKENTQTFRKFVVSSKSEAYDLLTTATSIIDYESTFGDSETTLYIRYYPNLQIEKVKRDDDTIYTLRNVETKETFTFATRSLIWPHGYGLEVRSV